MTTRQKEPAFTEIDLTAIAKCLAAAATHGELGTLFRDAGLNEHFESAGLSKWVRIYNALAEAQNRMGTGNFVMSFVQKALSPKRFLEQPQQFDEIRGQVNQFLAFHGWQILATGKFCRVSRSSTIDEAKERAGRLRLELERRKVHPDVLAFCRAELLQENFFHAVLEATKSVSEKIRRKTGLTGDAGDLATKALSIGRAGEPILAFNAMTTETDRSEQSGLMNLFVGMFGAFRNTTAHGPKVTWNVSEQEALDLLTLVSLLHRRLDSAIRTQRAT